MVALAFHWKEGMGDEFLWWAGLRDEFEIVPKGEESPTSRRKNAKLAGHGGSGTHQG